MQRIITFIFLVFIMNISLFSKEYSDLSIHGASQQEIQVAKKNNLVPRGSASITNSGALEKKGIKAIIHAAPGSMGKSGENFSPTLEGTLLSIQNSLRLAKKHHFKRIAFPLLGGGIFLSRMGVTLEQLILKTLETLNESSDGIEIILVGYSQEDFQKMVDMNKKIKKSKVILKKGSITDFSLHQAPIIVNAANTELLFGGGLSGVINRATQSGHSIDQQNKKLKDKFKN